MLTLEKLLEPYAYQPPEVQRSARVFIETVDGTVEAEASYRDIVDLDTGEEVEALVIKPAHELVRAPEDVDEDDAEVTEDDEDDNTCLWHDELACLYPDSDECGDCPFAPWNKQEESEE